jgi:hypothetical protein
MSHDDKEPIETGTEDGILWRVVEAPLYGAANGYVELPEGHPWRDKELQIEDSGLVDVHGGVTYGPTADGWIGFDTLHAFDVWPGSSQFMGPDRHDIAWTVEKVVAETKRLAVQVKAVTA